MNIVIDTNIFISALIKNSKTREIILNTTFNLLFPEYEFEEIFNHKREILKKSNLSEPEFNILLFSLLKRVNIIRTKRIINFRKKAEIIIGHIDKDDIIFIATALAFNCPIWSDDKHFKYQNQIKIITTKEMISLFKY